MKEIIIRENGKDEIFNCDSGVYALKIDERMVESCLFGSGSDILALIIMLLKHLLETMPPRVRKEALQTMINKALSNIKETQHEGIN